MSYTVDDFVEIIRDIEGVQYIREDVINGFCVVIMESRGRMVAIDKEDEELDDELGKGYLRALDIEFMIGALFPSISPEVLN